MVGRERFERSTNGLKVRCSTDWANDPITERFVLLINSTATILLKIYDLASIFLQKFHIFSRTWFLSGSYSTISFEILKTLPSLLIVNVRYSKKMRQIAYLLIEQFDNYYWFIKGNHPKIYLWMVLKHKDFQSNDWIIISLLV